MDRIITTEGIPISGKANPRRFNALVRRWEGRGEPNAGFEIDGDAPARLAYVETTMDLPVSDMLSNVSPDCRDGNHGKCFGTAWDLSIDEATACDCECGCSAEWAGEL